MKPDQTPINAMPALTRGQDQALTRIERLADLLDSRWRVPGTEIRFGLDSLFGLVPGVGDAAGLVASTWIMAEARSLGAPWHLIVRMGLNAALDLVIGIVPLVGDVLDVAFRANRRNAALLRAHLERTSFPSA